MSIFEEWKNKGTKDGGMENQIFTIRRLDWQGGSPQVRELRKLASSNNVLIAATKFCTLVRWNLDANSSEEEIELPRKTAEDEVEHVFLDPSGHHAIIAMKSAENFYLHSRSTRPKKLSRLPGGAIESVAFDRQFGGETATRSFLVGTTSGCVYEMAVDSGGKEKVCQMVYQLDKALPITSIHYEAIGSTSGDAVCADARIFVLLATSSPTRLYNFLGGPTLQQMFMDSSSPFIELPGEMPRAELTCYSKLPQTRAQMFALMSKEGIFHGNLLANSHSTSENVMMEAHLLPYANTEETPISIAATEYHFIALLSDRVQFISRLNGSLVQEEFLRVGDGIPLGLVRDAAKCTTWLYTVSGVFQITALNEDKKIWRIYLQKAVAGDEKFFNKAYQHSKNKAEQAEVLRAQAESNLINGHIETAACNFLRAGVPFEEIILRILATPTSTSKSFPPLATTDGPEMNALRVYLVEQLRILPIGSKSQRTMVCTWLCDVFLHQIASASFSGSAGGNGDLLSQFKDFIRTYRSVLDQGTTLRLLTSRGQGQHRALLLFYAQMVGDYDRVVAHYISEQRYNDAINLLVEAPFEQVEGLIYKCAPTLIQFEPESSVQMLISKKRLRVQGLLPALFRYEALVSEQRLSDCDDPLLLLDRDYQGKKVNFAVLYLQDVLSSAEENDLVPEAIVYHTLLWLLAKYDEPDEKQLVVFLQKICDKKASGLHQVYGLNGEYMLRQCQRFSRKRATVFSFLILGLEYEAAHAALDTDLDLAKIVAQKCGDSVKQKELWIAIAKHVIFTDKDAKRALALLAESGDKFKIEDLMPLLPDFTEIELFKDEMCHTLEECSSRIDHLKVEMDELSESAESISLELECMKKRGFSTSSGQRCEYCNDAIFNKQFYLFPCSHGFHSDCLLKRVFTHKHLDKAQLNTVKGLEDQLRVVAVRAKDNDKRALAQQEFLQNELDGFIAADCPLCGFVIIRSLSIPLVPDDSDESAAWRLDSRI